MHIDVSDEQRMLRDSFARFLDSESSMAARDARASRWDRKAFFSEEKNQKTFFVAVASLPD
jgi:hypothetical protein